MSDEIPILKSPDRTQPHLPDDPDIANKPEPERFRYYYEKACRALRILDTEAIREDIRKGLTEDPESLGHSVKWWRELTEEGPPNNGPEEGLAEWINEDLRHARRCHFETISRLEQDIGRAFLHAIMEGIDDPIREARKAIQAKREFKGDKRILLRRIVNALAGFYSKEKRVPTKGELYDTLDEFPIGDAAVTVTRRSLKISTRHDTPPRKVNKGQFSNALTDLHLKDLPEGKAGNPNFSNRLDEK